MQNMGCSIAETTASIAEPSSKQFAERMEPQGHAGRVEPQGTLPRTDQEKLNRTYLVNLIKEQGYRCALSGIELTPDTAALDHIVPVSKGGLHAVGNVAWVHEEINRMKGPMSVDEFVEMCRKVSKHIDSQKWPMESEISG